VFDLIKGDTAGSSLLSWDCVLASLQFGVNAQQVHAIAAVTPTTPGFADSIAELSASCTFDAQTASAIRPSVVACTLRSAHITTLHNIII
jgi:hypothetical protein